MPLLDFQCLKCGEKFEELVFTSTRNRVCCPKCSSNNLKQIYEGKSCIGPIGASSGSGSCSRKSCSCCRGCG